MRIAGFSVARRQDRAIVACAVLDARRIVATAVVDGDARQRIALMAAAYRKTGGDAELLMVEGSLGMLALGAELRLPCVAVAKSAPIDGEERDAVVYLDGEPLAKKVQTKGYARALFVSARGLDVKAAAVMVLDAVVLPHKWPEPLHHARRLAKQATASFV